MVESTLKKQFGSSPANALTDLPTDPPTWALRPGNDMACSNGNQSSATATATAQHMVTVLLPWARIVPVKVPVYYYVCKDRYLFPLLREYQEDVF